MKKYIFAILVTLLLSACGGEGGVKQIGLSDGWGSGELRMVTLDDGTKCAVVIGYCKAAISCDWEKNQ